MYRIALVTLMLILLTPFPVLATTDDDGWNEYTIRASDIPSDAPRFEDYPVKIYVGPNAAPRIVGDKEAHLFRTRILKWSREKPNFAGHYILATWGCGSNCTQVMIINAITGKVLHPPGLKCNESTNVMDELLTPGHFDWHAGGSIKFHLDSALLVVIGMPNEDSDLRGISYFVIRNDKLERVRFIYKPWNPEKPPCVSEKPEG